MCVFYAVRRPSKLVGNGGRQKPYLVAPFFPTTQSNQGGREEAANPCRLGKVGGWCKPQSGWASWVGKPWGGEPWGASQVHEPEGVGKWVMGGKRAGGWHEPQGRMGKLGR